jgi:hypothetical protein
VEKTAPEVARVELEVLAGCQCCLGSSFLSGNHWCSFSQRGEPFNTKRSSAVPSAPILLQAFALSASSRFRAWHLLNFNPPYSHTCRIVSAMRYLLAVLLALTAAPFAPRSIPENDDSNRYTNNADSENQLPTVTIVRPKLLSKRTLRTQISSFHVPRVFPCQPLTPSLR